MQKLDIKSAIKSHGLTVNEVAERIGIHRTGLSQHISGNPSSEVLLRIANAIGCDVAELFTASSASKPATVCPHCGKKLSIKIE